MPCTCAFIRLTYFCFSRICKYTPTETVYTHKYSPPPRHSLTHTHAPIHTTHRHRIIHNFHIYVRNCESNIRHFAVCASTCMAVCVCVPNFPCISLDALLCIHLVRIQTAKRSQNFSPIQLSDMDKTAQRGLDIQRIMHYSSFICTMKYLCLCLQFGDS